MKHQKITTYIFTHEELKLKRNVGVALILDELRKCGTDDGTQITIPVECYRNAMTRRYAPDLLERQRKPPSSPSAEQARKNPPCTHRGAEIDRVQCPTCSGVVMLKVFACPKHTRCCIAKTTDGIQSCAACPDHEPEVSD